MKVNNEKVHPGYLLVSLHSIDFGSESKTFCFRKVFAYKLFKILNTGQKSLR